MPQTLLNPSFESWAFHESEGGFAPASWTRAIAGSANLVANGGFGTNDLTSWTAAAGWAGTTGKAVHTAGIADTTALTQNISLSNTKQYLISFRTSGWTAGTITLGLENITSGPYALAVACEMTHYYTVTANATDATSLLSFTPNAAFNGAIDEVSVRLSDVSDLRICSTRANLSAYPSMFGLDFCVDATPNAVTLAGSMTLVAGSDCHFYFNHMWKHDDPAITAPDAHYATVQIKTDDNAHYLQANLTWGAGAYSFPISSLATMDRFSKRFTALSDHTAYTVTFSTNDLHGSAGYFVHQFVDNLHCEDVTDLTA